MNVYIGVEAVTDELLALLRTESGLRGVVLGDYTCTKRMFSGGFAEMVKFAFDVSGLGKEVVVQTPVYLTERNYEDAVKTVLFLHDECGVRRVLVQDVGYAKRVSGELQDMELIWSQMGRNRGSLVNLEFVRFLKNIGIRGFELSAPSRIQALAQVGLTAWACYGSFSYQSVSRNCFNQQIHREHLCRREECLGKTCCLKGERTTLSVDGHFLGRRTVYDCSEVFWTVVQDCASAVIVRGEDAESVRRHYDGIKGRLMEHE